MPLLLLALLAFQDVDALIKEAREASSKGDSEGAEKAYTQALERDADNLRALIGRAEGRRRSGNLEGALQDCNRVIDIRPNAAAGYVGRADVRAHQGNYADAIRDYDKAVELAPKWPNGYYLRGRARLAAEDYNGAITDCTKAVDLQPANAMSRYYRGAVWGVKQSWKDALADFRKVQELRDSDTLSDYAAVNVWICRSRAGEKAAATAELKEYLSKRTSDSPAPILRACKLLAGDVSEKEYLDWATAEKTKLSVEDRCEAFYYLGHARLAAGDDAGAESFFEKGVATGVRNCTEYHAALQQLRTLRKR